MTTATVEATRRELSAIEIAARCDLSADAQSLLSSETSFGEFARWLLAAEMFDDAIRSWAAALPVRQAIWWGALCVWEANRDNVAPAADAAYQCIVAWIEAPSEAQRRTAATLVKTTGATTPLGILLHALHVSGGSIAPPNLPQFEPDVRLFTKLLAEAVLLAARQIAINQSEDRRPEFISKAMRIAHEELTWQRQPLHNS